MDKYSLMLEDEPLIGSSLLSLDGTYGYTRRRPNVDLCKLKETVSNSTALADDTGMIKRLCGRAMTESKMFEDNVACSVGERYQLDDTDIAYDMYNAIESLGCMQYSKTCTLLYTLYDTLDYVLSYTFNEPLEAIRERLLSNCHKFGIDYYKLSYSFAAKDEEALQTVNLDCFVGLSDLLDLRLSQLTTAGVFNIYKLGSKTLDLTNPSYTPAMRITYYLLAKVHYFNRMVFNSILQLFKQGTYPFCVSAQCIPTSVGTASLVIAASSRCLPEINITIQNVGDLKLPVLEYKDLGVRDENSWYNHI